MPRYTIIQEPLQNEQPRNHRRSYEKSQEQYVQRLRQVLQMNRRNNQYYPNQPIFHSRHYSISGVNNPQQRYYTQKQDYYDNGNMYANRQDLNQNETVHLPKIRRKNKVARAIRYSQIDSNDKLIIRNYMNAKLIEFNPKKTKTKKKNKKRNHTVQQVGQLPQNYKNRKYYTYKSRTPIQGLQNFLVRDSNKFIKIRQKSNSSRTQNIQYQKHKRHNSYHPNSEAQLNYSEYLGRHPQNKYKSNKFLHNHIQGQSFQAKLNKPHYNSSGDTNSNSYVEINTQKNYSPYKDKSKQQQWEKIDPLNLETYFVKLKKIANISPDVSKLQKPKIKIPKIPVRQQYSKFIKNYIPEFQQIRIEDLIKDEAFQIIQDEIAGKQTFYFGQTKNDKRHGKGILITEKMVFQGVWSNDQKIRGIEITQTGKYKGQYLDGQRCGKGQFFWSHGQYYSGQWKNGKKNGSGYWKSLKGQSYMGEWKNGQVTGYGVHTMKTGQKYQGQFINFLKHGFGKQDFPNGDHYQGRYVQGQPHGNGKYIWKNNTVYTGDFVQGYRQGKGILTVPHRLQFQGNFKSQMIQGIGIVKYSNGDVYNGLFQNNKRNGHGILDLKSQKKIIKGIWQNDQIIKQQQ